MALVLPIKPVKLPSTLAGAENGKLNPLILRKLKSIPNALMELTAASAFDAMFFTAEKELVNSITDVGDYRDFQAQLDLFISRYNPVSPTVYNNCPSQHRKYWAQAKLYGYNSLYWTKKNNNLATAAVPGTSNHGWALALDIAEEYDTDVAPDPIRQKLVEWLVKNADRFGICAELQSEAWHWRYYAGDNIPQAVKDFYGVEEEMTVLDDPVRVIDTRTLPYTINGINQKAGFPVGPGQFDFNINRNVSQVEATVTVLPDDGNAGFCGVNVKDSFINWVGTQRGTPIPQTVTLKVRDGKIALYFSARVHFIVSIRAES